MLVAFENANQQLVALWVIRGVTPSPSPSPQHLKTLQKRFFLGGKTEEFTPTTMTVTKCTRIACQVILLVNMTLRTLIVSKLFCISDFVVGTHVSPSPAFCRLTAGGGGGGVPSSSAPLEEEECHTKCTTRSGE